MVRIACISDTHGQHSELALPEADLLIHAGDFMVSGKRLGEITSFNMWLEQTGYSKVVVVPGNHEVLFETDPGMARVSLTNAQCLIQSGVEIAELKVWGSPFNVEFNDWAFNVPRGVIRRYWDLIPEGLDVLITHYPPYGIFDQYEDGVHIGCEDLAEAVQRAKPKVHIFGHVHYSGGKSVRIGDTLYVNASVADSDLHCTVAPQVIEVDV
jgi:Icc-related predicted phosphoesterase